MANEATLRVGLRIYRDDSAGYINFNGLPTAFQVDVAGCLGPTPGAFSASVLGTDVDLSQLTTPGLCWIANLDDTNFVEYGIWDPENSKFFPLGEVGPKEAYPLMLSRNIQEEYQTGTGTTGANTNRLRIKADTAACNVFVGAFER